ncbi:MULTISPECIES: endonuclease domain-containing protein [Streptomyces]|uniref:endonuclease domain-containing protein n=1 Tax=Streptomyces TaxID=1883 RepID=UPI003B832E60
MRPGPGRLPHRGRPERRHRRRPYRLSHVCALCQAGPSVEPSPDAPSFWHDHDHRCCPSGRSCGRCVRGLLCLPCNATRLPAHERLPGILRDNPR